MAEESHYDLLQVQPTADLEIIQAAYRSMMRRYHPDQNPSHSAEATTKRLNEAWEILSDPGRRADYDRELAARRVGRPSQGPTGASSRPAPPPPRPPQPPRSGEAAGGRRIGRFPKAYDYFER